MEDITIRKATLSDIPKIMPIYESAKEFMRQSGNLTQWVNGYPGRKEVGKDIENGNLYVGVDDEGDMVCVFAFIVGNDPTYAEIDGAWLNDDPYGTVHRIASSGKRGGIVGKCVEFCFSMTDNIRIDTHRDNSPMLATLKRLGFIRCGVIICADGTPREAFQLKKT